MQQNNDLSIFNVAEFEQIKKNVFNKSFEHLSTFQFGKLYPVLIREVLPTAHYTISTVQEFKFEGIISPFLTRVKAVMRWFFVPNRLVWSNWEPFISDSESGIQRPTLPWYDGTHEPTDITPFQTIGAYMGLPLGTVGLEEWLVDAMPLAGLACIYNNYFRETSVMPELTYQLVDGLNVVGTDIDLSYSYSPLLVLMRKDYFTSALPAAQKGSPILMPITSEDYANLTNYAGASSIIRNPPGGSPISGSSNWTSDVGGGFDVNGGTANAAMDVTLHTRLYINQQAASIDALRTAIALQLFVYKDGVGGGRYNEILHSHFGYKPPDFRLQRPEYLGGSVQSVVVSDVFSTAETVVDDTVTPLATRSGRADSIAMSEEIRYFVPEHGYLHCYLSIVPDVQYKSQGFHRQWLRETREEYAWPEFAHLGEQGIFNYELTADHTSPRNIFGYQMRYAEYKYWHSIITGELADTLNYWHLGISVGQDVALNGEFLRADQRQYDWTRVFSVDPVEGEVIKDYIIGRICFNVKAVLPLPRYSVPKIIG